MHKEASFKSLHDVIAINRRYCHFKKGYTKFKDHFEMKLILLLTLTTIATCFRNIARISRFDKTTLFAKIDIVSRHIDLTEPLKNRVESKIGTC